MCKIGTEKKTVLLGMSGGVDSTVAALLLARQGYTVVGATLYLHEQGSPAGENALRDIADAKAAAERLGIRHLVLDWRVFFRERVLAPFAGDYARGATPNPCVVCNRQVKFPSLLEAADREGIQYIATGHYARVEQREGHWRLCAAKYLRKDQSYALYGLRPAWLPRILFPLGDYDKNEVRALALEAGLEAVKRGDSQDICFVPDGDYTKFLEDFTGEPCPTGSFVDESGQVLGRHRGLWRYTIGQRRGLGTGFGERMFVGGIDALTHNITLTRDERLYAAELVTQDLMWTGPAPPPGPVGLSAKIRYAHTPQPCTVTPLPQGGAHVVFAEPQRAITPGQAVVFYRGDCVVGGGTILRTGQPH